MIVFANNHGSERGLEEMVRRRVGKVNFCEEKYTWKKKFKRNMFGFYFPRTHLR